MKIAFITYEDQGKYASSVESEDDKLLHFLQSKGLDIGFEIWTDPEVDWKQYSLALLKSPWDYFDKIDRFYNWLDKMESLGIRMLNPYSTIKWNSDKHYLKDIADAGLPVTPSFYLEKGQNPELNSYFSLLQTNKLIIKPCISGGAKNTFAITEEEVMKLTPTVHHLLGQEAFIVQPFYPQIQMEGEWSLIFFNGRFSHCVLKKTKSGDFRVQHYLGGTIHPEMPSALLLQAAAAYVEKFAKDCLYARVDGLIVDNQFVLMELELIEPFFFMFTNPKSYENYYQALTKFL